MLIGVWSGFGIHRWVGAHWAGAQPAAVFWALRWVVTLFGALAVVALFGAIAEHTGRVVRESPVGWLDRCSGVVTGALVGAGVASLIVLGMVRMPFPRWLRESAAHARSAPTLLAGGAEVCRWCRPVPGGTALRRQYLEARHRIQRPYST